MDTSGKIAIGVVISVLGIGAKVIARASRSSSFGSSRSYDALGRYDDPYRYGGRGINPLDQYRRDLDALPAEPPPSLDEIRAQAAERHCEALGPTRLELSFGIGRSPVDQVIDDVLAAMLPAGSRLPDVQVDGLDVIATRKDELDDDTTFCLDTNRRLVTQSVASQLDDAQVEEVQPGLWRVATSDQRALWHLLRPATRQRRGLQGPLVAFAQNEDLLLLVDSSNVAAVRLGATLAASGTRPQSDECSELGALEWTGKQWRKWKPAEPLASAGPLQQAKAMAMECERSGAVRLIEVAPKLKTTGFLSISHTAFDAAATRRLDGVKVVTELDGRRRELVTRSDQVRLGFGADAISWEDFVAHAGRRLEPFTWAGKMLDGYFVVAPATNVAGR